MADQPTNDIWPMPKFYFVVEWGDGIPSTSFQEVAGLDTEAQIIEYRAGNSKEFSTVRMPELTKTGTIILKKGVFARDHAFFDWFNAIKMNTIQRQTVTIKLLDESGTATMVWTLQDAWPAKIIATNLESDEKDMAVEIVELVCNSVTMTNG